MRNADWLIPIGLMLLGAVPFVAGVLRIVEIGGDPVITPENARFVDDPVPVVIHIATSLTFSILGALHSHLACAGPGRTGTESVAACWYSPVSHPSYLAYG